MSGPLRALLDELSETTSGTTPPPERVATAVRRALELDDASLLVLGPEGRVVRATGAPCPGHAGSLPGAPVRRPLAEHPCPELVAELAAKGTREVALVPVPRGREPGALLVLSGAGRALADLDDDALGLVGRLVGCALEHARLADLAESRRDFDRVMLEAARLASSSEDLETILGKFTEALVILSGALRGAVGLESPGDPPRFTLRASFGGSPEELARANVYPVDADEPVLRRAIDSRRLVLAHASEVRSDGWRAYLKRTAPWIAVLPLVAREHVFGLAFVRRASPFEEDARVRLEAVAHELALAVEAAAERDAKRRAREGEAVVSELRGLVRARSLDAGAVFERAVSALGRTLSLSRCVIALVDPEHPGAIAVRHEYRDSPSLPSALSWRFADAQRPIARAGAGPEPLVCHDVAADPRFGRLEAIAPGDYRAFVLVNFVDGDVQRGGLLVGRASPHRWEPEEVDLVRAVADECAIALSRARSDDSASRRSHELELLIESMADGVLMVNERLEVVRLNSAARAILWHARITSEELGGGPRDFTVHELDGRTLAPADYPVARAAKLGEHVQEREILLRHVTDGRERVVSCTAAPIRDPGGRLTGAVVVFRDVTAAKAAAIHARRMERLRVAGELAASVAHELNNMLAVVMGHAEAIERTSAERETRAGASVIVRAAADAGVVLGRLTRLSKRSDEAARRPTDLARIAQDVVELTRPRWSKPLPDGGAIELRLDAPSTVLVRGDAAELREVLTNLVLNSLDALSRGGRIGITVAAEGDTAIARVEDDGAGMAPDVLRSAFEPFFTTKGERGTGLGLSISSAIVEGHGGRIEARSAPGAGTTMTIRLPLLAARGSRVLVVDDDARIREVLATLLAADGYLVSTAGSGEEGLEVASGHDFDVLVTDFVMPGMSGIALAEEVRRSDSLAGIVVVSGSAPREETARALTRLGGRFVMKPFRVEDVLAAVTAVCPLRTPAAP
jgi:PAS domain S-box-containing protein